MFDAKGQRKYLNKAERQDFYRAVSMINHPRDRALGLTLYYTGCRPSEASALDISNIDTGENVIMFRTLKQRKKVVYRAVPVPQSLIEDLLLAHRLNGKLFPLSRTRVYKIVKDFMKRAGITGIKATSKGLRHGFAVACIENNIPLTLAQKFMGHSRLESTRIYLDIIGKEEREFASRLWRH